MGRPRRCGFHPWVGKILWRRKWQPTPEFLPEKSHGQKSLVGNCSWGHKESDMTVHTQDLTFLEIYMKVSQSCLTLCNSMDYIVHGIFQARILEWVPSPFSRGSSQPRDWTQVSCITGGFFTNWPTREAQRIYTPVKKIKMGGEFGGEWIHVYECLSPFSVHLKLSQCC